MDIPLLNVIIIALGLASVVLLVSHRLRLPTVVGLLATGVVAGPHGFGLIKAKHEVEMLAEIGVVLLLFTIGIEFSFKNLLRIRKTVLIGGSVQVLATVASIWLIAGAFGQETGQAVFLGFLTALSSTAIVLRVLQDRAEVDSPHGGAVLGILIFQDLIIVPMILLTPLLAGKTGGSGSLALMLTKAAGIIVLVALGAKWIVPRILYRMAMTRNREIFLLGVVVICLGVAWLTHAAGLSLALGAFMAGLIISESEYSHHTLGNILPFKDVFTTFFFISIGMLLDFGFFLKYPGYILLAALGVLVVKATLAGGTALLLGLPWRTAVLVALALAQVGEFSFILARSGVEHGLLADAVYQSFLAVSVICMAATPFLIAFSPRAADLTSRLPLPALLKSGFAKAPEPAVETLSDHLVIIGYGVNGRNLAMAAGTGGIPYLVIEMNPETVRKERARGEPILFGDATREAVLRHAGLDTARVVVVAINDAAATRRIADTVRRLNPRVHLIVRTRFVQEVPALYDLGADEVIPEEFETSVEIFTRVLSRYLIPRDDLERIVARVRADGYRMFRSLSQEPDTLADVAAKLPGVELGTIRVKDDAPLAGRTLAQLGLRQSCGVNVLAVLRGTEVVSNPGGDLKIQVGDVLYVLGPTDGVCEAAGLARPDPTRAHP
ncbi:MAG: cation:proton antiporter [Thermodesulfobacteriota bacterium]